MTYMRVDVAFPGCLKAQRAGGEAIWLWLAMKAYSKAHGTNGFVPREKIGRLEGPKPSSQRRLVKRLVEATGHSGEHGLVDEVDGGYQLHDYLEHEESAEQAQRNREAARIRKQRYDARRAENEATGNAVTEPLRTESGARPSNTTDPNQAKPSQAKPNHPAKAGDGDAPSSEQDFQETICPLDLVDRFTGFPELSQKLNVPEPRLRQSAEEFLAYWTIGAGIGLKRPGWARRLRQHLVREAQQGKLDDAKPKGGWAILKEMEGRR